MKTNRKLNIIVALVLAITMVMPMSSVAYAAENEAYVYKYAVSEDFNNNDVYYANGTGSTPAYLRYTTGPEGMQQYGGYCADFESTVSHGSMYSRTTLGESGHFSASVTGHLRAILANSVPVVSLDTLKAKSGVSGLEYGEAVAATQWAIWAYTNPSSPEIAVPKKTGKSDKERAAYYLYNLPPVASGYATEPILMSFTVTQEGNKMIFDYSGSTNIAALYDKKISVEDEIGNAIPYVDKNNKIIVDVSGLTKDQTIGVVIEGKQVLAADAYFYNPQGGRKASQSLISWFQGVTSVAGIVTGKYDVEKEKGKLILTGDKSLTGRAIDPAIDKFQFVVKDAANGKTVANGTSDESGNIVFTAIEYTKADRGKVFNYLISEVKGDNPGITYDGKEISVAVKVGYENGKVVTSVDYGEATGIEFINKYTTEDGDIGLKVLKKMEGKDLQEGQFQFTKVECNAEGTPLEGAEYETVTNKADGTVEFNKETYAKEGIHYYLIEEVDGGKRIDGITYDDMKVVVKVTVTDNKLGKLVATAEYPADITFNNCYTADATTAQFGGQKVLEGRPLAAEEFTFILKNAAGEIVEKVTNAADGTFGFQALEFKTAGEYVYTVTEEIGSTEGVEYDNTVHKVVVKVTDDGKGKLHAVVNKPESGIVFNNKYTGQGQITVTKTLNINDAPAAENVEFEVGLFTDAECTEKAVLADGTEVANQIIRLEGAASGAVTFKGLEYGTYYVAEIGADGTALAEGVVTGKLIPQAYKQVVAYEGNEVAITREAKSSEAGIVNDFYTEEYYMQGAIKVTKQVVVGDAPEAVTATYMVALFADPELTTIASDIKRIELNEQQEASVVFEGMEINKTYYVAETDYLGTPIEAGDYNIKAIGILNGVIEVVPLEEPVPYEVTIINYYDEHEDDEGDLVDDEGDLDEEETVTEEEIEEKEDKAVQTGDEFNVVFVGGMMMLALIGMAVAALIRRKEVNEK